MRLSGADFRDKMKLFETGEGCFNGQGNRGTDSMTTNSTLGERVHEIIRDDILAGRYQPGERLFFEAVARETGVSMTPIKEAFMLLEKEGLVVSVARKGTFVRELSADDIREYYQIRRALEALAVDLVCAKGLAPEDEKALRETCDILENHIVQGDAGQSVLDDVRFHCRMVDAAGNRQLSKLVKTLPLTNLFNMVQESQYYLANGKIYLGEHRRIIRLLKKGDGETVKKMLFRHITAGDLSVPAGAGAPAKADQERD